MTPGEIRKLLGGYATGTLSNEERNLLYSAALADQELFDALADEETLRELLAEPNTRQALIEELQRQPAPSTSPLENQQAPPQFGAPPQSAKPFWSQMLAHFTSRRLAVAGGLAMLLLIAGTLQYRRLHAPVEVAVNLLKDRLPEPSSSTSEQSNAARRIRDEEPKPKPLGRGATPPASGAPKETARQLADTRLSDARRAEEGRSAAGAEQGIATPRKDENRAAVPSSAAPAAADAEAKVQKETDNTGPARERLNQAVRGRIVEAQPAKPGSAESPPPPGAVFSDPPANSAPPAPKSAALATQFRQIDAKVTDLNGTIVSINVGSNFGFNAGDTIEILRDNRVIATSKLSQVGATFAVGPVQRTPGSTDVPRAGDLVRRAASSPQR